MLILADENCDAVLVTRPREAGHDLVHILEQQPGTPDNEILESAAAQDRFLLTNDLDFGMLAERMEIYPPAIILMRLDPLRANIRGDIVTCFFESE